MKKQNNVIENILSLLLSAPMAMVQLSEHNKRAGALMAIVLILLPMGALATDTLASSPAILILNASETKSVSYSITQVGTCDVSISKQAMVTPNLISGITTNSPSVNITACIGGAKTLNFIAPASITAGNYTITAAVSGGISAINATTGTFTIKIPPIRPVITILGANPASLVQGTVYTDAGATALDSNGTNITLSIIKGGSVNNLIIGTYHITYDVTDSNGVAAIQAIRTVNVVAPAPSGSATVILAFDDGWYTTINHAYPVLNGNGQKGVVFAITQPEIESWGCGTDTDSSGNPCYMALDNLNNLYLAGWDISSHSYTHGSAYPTTNAMLTMEQAQYLVRANNSELEYELGESKAQLDLWGFTRSSMFFAYPFGAYDNVYCLTQPAGTKYTTSVCGNNNLPVELQNEGYYVGARTIDNYAGTGGGWSTGGKHPRYKNTGKSDDFGDNPYCSETGTVYACVHNDPLNIYRMATFVMDNTADTYPQKVFDEVNKTIADNGLLVLTFHRITPGNPTSSEEYSLANLTLISNWLAQNPKVNVQTFSQYFGVPNTIPSYNPGTPIAGATIYGSDWANVTWTDGAGDKTNVFDVGITIGSQPARITYNVVNRFMNITGLATNTPVVVQVSAINRSWGQTNRNPIPLVINAMIHTYMPPTPVSTTISGSNNLTWDAGVGNGTNNFDVNVNGAWTNNTMVKFYDATGRSPGIYTVKVYAVNSTNGITTINPTPLTLSATIVLVLPTYMPPMPVSTTGVGSKNLTWDTGVGNNGTDNFDVNVNGTWTNNTMVKFIDVTDNSPGTYTVNVYAVNTTNGNTINQTPLTLSATIVLVLPTYMPPTPTNITNTTGSDWILTQWGMGTGGNMTDVYNVNVNGVLVLSNTTDESYNATGLSIGNYTDVAVYAVNTTNGYTQNTVPAELNTSIAVPAQVVITHGSGGSGGSGGGGGGSGGGGGGSMYDPNAYKFERSDTQIIVNLTSIANFKDNGLVNQITFYGIQSYGVITAMVSLLKGNPTSIPINGATEFFSVSLGTIKQNEEYLFFKNCTITLSLNVSDIGNKQVKFYRFVNGSWELLGATELVSTPNSTMESFKLTTAGFSYFAIVMESPVQTVSGMVNVPVSVAPTVPVPTAKITPGFDAIAAISVLFMAVLIAHRNMKSKKQ